MARYIGPVCRLCRREDMKLFLKGDRCYTDKCGYERRAYPPGQHGQARRKKASDYREQLREKSEGSRDLGMDGTWVIHPQQAEIANAVFMPSDEQIEATKRSLDVYHKLGGGSIADPETGEFYDEATTKGMLMQLAKAAQGGKVSYEYLEELAAKSKAVSGYDILEVMGRVA